MKRADELAREVDVLRERLFRLSEANVRINESLDFDTVLQGILDSARSLTGARFGLLVLADESGREQDLLVSGLAAHEHQRFMEWFKAEEVLFECLNRIPGPLRSKDFNSDAKAAGFPAFRPPVESVKCPMAYLTAPILHRGASVRYTRHALATAGYAPIVTGDPGDVPRIIRAKNPRLVLLDLMLPGSNGIELMGRILNITDVPVVFMSAYAQDDVIARALDTGAVDYIVKPFSPTELVARIRAALRERSALHHGDLPEPYVFAELTVDFAERRVTLSGQPVRLTSTEYQLLAELSRNAGRVVTYDQLLRRVWKVAGVIDMRPMRTAVKSLRRERRPLPVQDPSRRRLGELHRDRSHRHRGPRGTRCHPGT